ncbi:MAG: hypothetical protein IJO52_08495 [Clostridia bacterium]|nr:hypothetical protein [Clostridia bacterium]
MKKALLSIALIAVAAIAFSVVASNGTVQKNLLYEDIKITLDGREIKPCDVNGNYIEPFIIEGTTYLPVRGVASSLGLTVDWDGNTNTVLLDEAKPDVISVLYDENGVMAAYKEMRKAEEGAELVFLVQNHSDNDIAFIVSDIWQSSIKDVRKHYFTVESGKTKEVTISVNKVKETEFTFAVKNEFTQRYICKETEVIADSEKAEIKKIEEKGFEVSGEITRDTFIDFIKTCNQYDPNGALCGVAAELSDVGICKVGAFKMEYASSTDEIILSITSLSNVYDPIKQENALMPVTFTVDLGKNKEKYVCELSAVFDINVKVRTGGKFDVADGMMEKITAKYEGDEDRISNDYKSLEGRKAMDNALKDLCKELLGIMMSEGEKIFAEKAPGLSLEFFELK